MSLGSVKRLLIANRGEVACRIIKTARKMGIMTIAVYSEVDTNSLHVRLADKAIFIGPSPSTQSYLDLKNILNAIKISGADSVHPGYGFLSENPGFAQLLENNNITFVGPSSQAIAKMADKIEAKKVAKTAGVNIIPGYIGEIRTDKQAISIANKIGYPIMLKAVAGGGGKGMRIVRSNEEMKQALNSTANEARNNFADPRTFIEKFIENPRHIEVQVLGDQHGNYVCLGERECSIQRHHQKVIEEAPSTFIDEKMRRKLYKQTIALAKKVKYFSAGTVEYIVDQNKNFYFLEMNTRLQVEHPVTELITGIDLVEQMIRVARGEQLSFTQKDVQLTGWAFESRIYAEDPRSGFLPSTGRIDSYQEPPHTPNIRVDTGVYSGAEVSMFYDAMIAKLCTHAPTRAEAIALMQKALSQYVIHGISHNITFLQDIYSNPKFLEGDISTNFIENEYKGGFTGSKLTTESSAILLCATVFIFLHDLKRASKIAGQLRNKNRAIGTRWIVKLEEDYYPVTVRPITDGYKIAFESRRFYITSKWVLGSKMFYCSINGTPYNIHIDYSTGSFNLTFMGHTVNTAVYTPRMAELRKFMKPSKNQEERKKLKANISGIVVDIKVEIGMQVTQHQPVLILDAMKMENILCAPCDGIVEAIYVKKGDIVTKAEVLITFI
jgi:propionyl-CoA carboxylase alpha chain